MPVVKRSQFGGLVVCSQEQLRGKDLKSLNLLQKQAILKSFIARKNSICLRKSQVLPYFCNLKKINRSLGILCF
jgi:hypothetical protein